MRLIGRSSVCTRTGGWKVIKLMRSVFGKDNESRGWELVSQSEGDKATARGGNTRRWP